MQITATIARIQDVTVLARPAKVAPVVQLMRDTTQGVTAIQAGVVIMAAQRETARAIMLFAAIILQEMGVAPPVRLVRMLPVLLVRMWQIMRQLLAVVNTLGMSARPAKMVPVV